LDGLEEDRRDGCIKFRIDAESFTFEVQRRNCHCERFRRHRLAEIGGENRIVGGSLESLH
jgi:hypothetical protein